MSKFSYGLNVSDLNKFNLKRTTTTQNLRTIENNPKTIKFLQEESLDLDRTTSFEVDKHNDPEIESNTNLMDSNTNLMDSDSSLMGSNLMDSNRNLMDSDSNLMDSNTNLMDSDSNLMIDSNSDPNPIDLSTSPNDKISKSEHLQLPDTENQEVNNISKSVDSTVLLENKKKPVAKGLLLGSNRKLTSDAQLPVKVLLPFKVNLKKTIKFVDQKPTFKHFLKKSLSFSKREIDPNARDEDKIINFGVKLKAVKTLEKFLKQTISKSPKKFPVKKMAPKKTPGKKLVPPTQENQVNEK